MSKRFTNPLNNPIDISKLFWGMLLLVLITALPLQAQYTEIQKLLASDKEDGEFFGVSVAISGDVAIVGAVLEESDGLNANGAAYIFERISGTWTEVQKLLASDKAGSDYFGTSVAISGDVAIVGARTEDSDGVTNNGAAYIFKKNSSGTWTEIQKLLASDKAQQDLFGTSVAISGDVAIVGAIGGSSDGIQSGSAYIFERNGSTWTETKLLQTDKADGDRFGGSVAISGDVAIVGAFTESSDGLFFNGAAYIFERTGTTWTETQKLLASDKSYEDWFGSSVAISGNVAIIGAGNQSRDGLSANGAAYIFEKNSSGTWAETQKLLASDKANTDRFGRSVAISGNVAIVGANEEDSDGVNDNGAAYIFEKNSSGTWAETQKLLASDKADNDLFGAAVAISGDVAFVGAYQESSDGVTRNGAAYIFQNIASECSNQVFDDMEHGDPFGNGWFAFSPSTGTGGIASESTDLPPTDGGNFSLRTNWLSLNGAPEYYGGFGKNLPLDLSLNTHFSFWINPIAGEDYTLEINLQEDDNGDNFAIFSAADDDEFDYYLSIGSAGSEVIDGGGWQKVSISLSDFVDDNNTFVGGNGVFDPTPTSAGGNGQLINVVFTIISNTGTEVKFIIDNLTFTCEAEPILHEYTLLASEEITTSKFAFIEGNIHSNENIEIKKGRDGEINGNITAVEEIEVEKKNIVNGNITADEVDADDATVNGSVTEDVVDVVPFPTIDPFSAGSEDVEHTSGTLELAPGSYDDIEVSKRATLILSAGDYYADELSLYKDANLEVDVSNGPVNLYLEDEYRHDKNVEVRVVGGSTRDFTIYSLTTKRIKIHEYFEGNLIAPESREVRLESNTFFKGQICAEDISLKSKSMAVSHNYSGSIPKLAVEGDDENKSISNTFVLEQNYPNPFNPTTTIRFSLPEANTVSVKIFNVQGQLVRTLVNGALASGLHTYEWDAINDFGQRVSSGIYFYQLQSKNFNQVKKMILMK